MICYKFYFFEKIILYILNYLNIHISKYLYIEMNVKYTHEHRGARVIFTNARMNDVTCRSHRTILIVRSTHFAKNQRSRKVVRDILSA